MNEFFAGPIDTPGLPVRPLTPPPAAVRAPASAALKAECARAVEMLTRVVSSCAHDYNNLLTVILGVSELRMARLAPDDPVRADFMEIARAADRAVGVTRQLGGIAREGAGEREAVDVNLRLRRIEGMLRCVTGSGIEFVLAPALVVRPVRIDPTSLDEAVFHIVKDACDAMRHGGSVRVETRVDGPAVEISISDTGLESPEELRVGLAHARRIVADAGGDILASGRQGRGTSVRMRLPAMPAIDPKAPPQDASATSARGNETVLLVEEDPGVRRVTAGALRLFGYKVLEAGRAEEALAVAARAQESPIRLLVADLLLQGTDGQTLHRNLRLRIPGIRVLFLNGFPGPFATGPSGIIEEPVLHKPYSPRRLAGWVRAAIDGVPPEAWGL